MPPPGLMRLAVISWWALDGASYFLAGTFRMLDNAAFQCIPVIRPPQVANKHILGPSLRPAHRCTFLNSQCSPASELTVKLLATRRENLARGGGGGLLTPLLMLWRPLLLFHNDRPRAQQQAWHYDMPLFRDQDTPQGQGCTRFTRGLTAKRCHFKVGEG